MAGMILLFCVTYIFVAAKCAQQLHVCYFQWWRIVPTSYVMAAMEVTILLTVVRSDTYWAILPMGTGGALGALSAMYLNRRVRA